MIFRRCSLKHPRAAPEALATRRLGPVLGRCRASQARAVPPPDPGKTTSPDAGPLNATLRSALVHRYSFNGIGTVVTDSVGTANGALFNATLDNRGVVRLTGTRAFVNLPNGLVSESNDCTIETWLTWNGGSAWQRIFDFGSNDLGESQRGNGTSYLFLTPRSIDNVLLAAYSSNGFGSQTTLPGTHALAIGEVTHVAVVIDSQSDRFLLYLNGVLDASEVLTQRLSEIQDVNVWVGMSQFSSDPFLNADMSELRFYARALSAREIRTSFELGP